MLRASLADPYAQNDTNTGQIKVDQIYVERLTPRNATQPYPLVFWTGNGQTGTVRK